MSRRQFAKNATAILALCLGITAFPAAVRQIAAEDLNFTIQANAGSNLCSATIESSDANFLLEWSDINWTATTLAFDLDINVQATGAPEDRQCFLTDFTNSDFKNDNDVVLLTALALELDVAGQYPIDWVPLNLHSGSPSPVGLPRALGQIPNDGLIISHSLRVNTGVTPWSPGGSLQAPANDVYSSTISITSTEDTP